MSRDGQPGPYLRYDPSLEQALPDEAEVTQAILESIGRTNAASFKAHHHGIRQQHAKGQGYLKGELIVRDDLPDHLRQGLFATPGSYPIIVRLSTAFGDIRSDRIRVPRGMAIKVLGVGGAKALAEDSSANQDFLLVNHKSYFSDARAYLTAQRSFELQPSTPDIALRAIGLISRGVVRLFAKPRGHALLMIARALGDDGNNLLGERYYSQAALRFGDYVARLCANPVSPALRSLAGQPCHDGDDAVLDAVTAFFKANAAEYEICAQLGTDAARTPIEDASIDWPADVAPEQVLGRIKLPAQIADSPARRAYADDVLSFDPWRCLDAHRPLGSIMRVRRDAYQLSRTFRDEKNGPRLREPGDISEFPD